MIIKFDTMIIKTDIFIKKSDNISYRLSLIKKYDNRNEKIIIKSDNVNADTAGSNVII